MISIPYSVRDSTIHIDKVKGLKERLDSLTARISTLESGNIEPSRDTEDISESDAVNIVPTAARSYDFRNATLSGNTLTISNEQLTVVGSNHSVDSTDGFSTEDQNYVTFTPYNFGTEWSIEIYFKMYNPATNNQAIFGAGTLESPGNWIQIQRDGSSARLRFLTWNSAEINAVSSSAVAGFDNQFGHLVITYSQDDGADYYSNGTLITVTDGGSGADVPTGERTLILGSNLDTTLDNGEDSTRRLAIYSTKLSQQDVTALYNQRDP